MKQTFRFLSLLLITAIVALQSSCSEDEPAVVFEMPEVTTSVVIDITENTATGVGEVISDGGTAILESGLCWSINPMPTILDDTINSVATLGSFSGFMTNLEAGTTYYVRAYAINEVGTAYGNEVMFTTLEAINIEIGETFGGGIIFYVDGSGEHGLIAAPSDQGTVNWGCQGMNISGTSTAIGSGMANTLAIVNACSEEGIAARICDDLELNGFDDWYLPSKDELKLMHVNLYLQGLGGFIVSRYWSSSQYNSQFAWCQLFNLNNNQLFYDKDLIPYRIRAIRSF